MGELSLRWPSRHGFPRSHRGKSHHPQGSRQVLSCTRPQRRRTAGIKDQESFPSIDSNAQLLTCIPQSVTTTPAHTQPPKWTTFSPPPTQLHRCGYKATFRRFQNIFSRRGILEVQPPEDSSMNLKRGNRYESRYSRTGLRNISIPSPHLDWRRLGLYRTHTSDPARTENHREGIPQKSY